MHVGEFLVSKSAQVELRSGRAEALPQLHLRAEGHQIHLGKGSGSCAEQCSRFRFTTVEPYRTAHVEGEYLERFTTFRVTIYIKEAPGFCLGPIRRLTF